MRDFEVTLKFAGVPTRTRILKLLEQGGLRARRASSTRGGRPRA